MASMCPKLEQEKYEAFLLENKRNSLQRKVLVMAFVFFAISSLFLRINNYGWYFVGVYFTTFGYFCVYAYKKGLPFGLGVELPDLPMFERDRYSNYIIGKLVFVLSPFSLLYSLDLPLFYPIWERDVSWDAFTDVLDKEFNRGLR